MAIHDLLKRQLNRIGVNQDTAPSLEKWQALLERVNKVYEEHDQERYLNEIAIEVSSRETSELNKKLEHAQHIAHLGYWTYDRETGKIQWSKEMYELFGYDPVNPIPSYDTLMNRLTVEDRNHLQNLIKQAWESGENYEMDAKILNKNGDHHRWLYFAGHPQKTLDGTPIRYLSGIARDITSRKAYEDELHKLNQQLVASARRAGMAEIATSVLHNIGNILNSVNVSVELIQKYIQKFDIDNIMLAIQMINDHINSLEDFLKNDPKGKLLPTYFTETKKMLAENSNHLRDEISRLKSSILHIKEIVAMQNTLSGVSKMIEKISVSELIDTVILHVESSLTKNEIQLEKQYENIPSIETDKNKVMQILINLLQNAKDSLIITAPGPLKKITISAHMKSDNNYVEIKVTDTGLGILPENLSRIFTFGFTTKPQGHGFGLHSGALLAKELGGKLEVESEGIGHGATFVLTLPLTAVSNRSDSYERQV